MVDKKTRNNILILAFAGAMVFLILFGTNYLQITRKGLVWNPRTPTNGDETGDGAGNGQQPPSWQPPDWIPPDYTPPSNERAPTSITAFVSPNPITMGGWVVGTASSDGYNYAITVYAKHLGDGTVQSFAGLLGNDGKYELAQQINTPGFWQFWVESGGVKSNVVDLTVQGILIVSDRDHVSQTFAQPVQFKIYSHYRNANYDLVGYNHAASFSVIMTSGRTTYQGYAEVTYDMTVHTRGTYEIDVINLAGEKASDYGGTCWVTVGR